MNAARLSAVAIALLAVACSATRSSPSSDGPVRTTSAPIVNGTDSDATQNYVVLLVGLIDSDAGESVYQCSGTLLAPNLVLTARHCVSQVAEGGFGCDEKGNLLPGSTGGIAGADNPPSSMFVFVGATRPKFSGGNVTPDGTVTQIFHDSNNVLCSHDLALVLLDKKIPNATIASIRLDSPPTTTETITAIGWGITTTAASPKTRQQRSAIPIVALGPSAGSAESGPVPPSEFEVGESICSGDSGGPAISDATGAVIGSVSAGGNGASASGSDPAAGCVGANTFNTYTEVAPFKDLILSAYQAAGAQPWLEGQPNPNLASTGGACTADTDCQSGACESGECVATCDSSTPCGDGLTCISEDTRSVCLTPSKNAATASSSGGCAMASSRAPDIAIPFAAVFVLGARKRRRRANPTNLNAS